MLASIDGREISFQIFRPYQSVLGHHAHRKLVALGHACKVNSSIDCKQYSRDTTLAHARPNRGWSHMRRSIKFHLIFPAHAPVLLATNNGELAMVFTDSP